MIRPVATSHASSPAGTGAFEAETFTSTGQAATAAAERIEPAEIRYIKLGAGGRWEGQALVEGKILWGNGTDALQQAALGAWNDAEIHYLDTIADKGAATSALRELRDFFTLGADTLWITFAQGKMWWAFSEPAEVLPGAPAEGPSAVRRTIGPWRDTDVLGRPLNQAGLSSKLTQLAAYRRSICAVRHAPYALRRINGEEEAGVALLRSHRQALIDSAAVVIRDLHWRDFELLVDLVFTNAGWRRISEVGGTMKDIDLLLEQPVTGERISVQVKSNLDQAAANKCIAAFDAGAEADRFFLVFHTGRVALAPDKKDRPVHFWDCSALAQQVVDAGLTEWLMGRAG